MRFGGDTMDGYTTGLQDKQNDPLAAISSIAQRISKLGASLGLTLGAGLAVGIHPAIAQSQQWQPLGDQDAKAETIRFDTRKPLANMNKPSQQVGNTTIQITINPTPGMDPTAIAKAVAQELDRRDRQNAARQRSSLHDNSTY